MAMRRAVHGETGRGGAECNMVSIAMRDKMGVKTEPV